jgi:hypothetical protein
MFGALRYTVAALGLVFVISLLRMGHLQEFVQVPHLESTQLGNRRNMFATMESVKPPELESTTNSFDARFLRGHLDLHETHEEHSEEELFEPHHIYAASHERPAPTTKPELEGTHGELLNESFMPAELSKDVAEEYAHVLHRQEAPLPQVQPSFVVQPPFTVSGSVPISKEDFAMSIAQLKEELAANFAQLKEEVSSRSVVADHEEEEKKKEEEEAESATTLPPVPDVTLPAPTLSADELELIKFEENLSLLYKTKSWEFDNRGQMLFDLMDYQHAKIEESSVEFGHEPWMETMDGAAAVSRALRYGYVNDTFPSHYFKNGKRTSTWSKSLTDKFEKDAYKNFSFIELGCFDMDNLVAAKIAMEYPTSTVLAIHVCGEGSGDIDALLKVSQEHNCKTCVNNIPIVV